MEESFVKLGAIYFERNNIGICFYNSSTLRLQSSCIYQLCSISHPIISNFIFNCTTILTNCPTHLVFSQLAVGIVQTVSDKALEYEVIEHNLMRVTSHIANLVNPRSYFTLMAQSTLKFKALGMILFHQLSHNMSPPKIFLQDLQYFQDTLLQYIHYGRSQLQFLQITKQDIHPSLIKGKGASKQGYSVISAYESYLQSAGSKRILKHILLNPTYNKDTINNRHITISWMKHFMNESSLYNKHFRNIHVLESILRQFGKMNAEEDQWKKLIKTLEAMLALRNSIAAPDMPAIVAEYVCDSSWDQLERVVETFRQNVELDPLSIKGGVDPTLDRLKQTYDNMPHLLTLIARQQQWDLTQFRIVFMAQVGYLIKIGQHVQLPNHYDWQLQFRNNNGKFYSNELTLTLDSQYGDIFGEIQDIQKKILLQMESLIIEREQSLLSLYWKLCQIECFWGISQLSKNMCAPRLSSEAFIIIDGWHLLLTGHIIHNNGFSFPQKQAPKSQVYNSEKNLVNLNYSNRCSIITGPNAAGKTVYMKQLGLIVYLTHTGVFVPASVAEVPLVDAILFVGGSESIYNDQRCGFSSELQSLSSITQPKVISNKALILIDQLGSQIDYQNSLKLLYATIQYLTISNQSFRNNRLLTHQSNEFQIPLVLLVTHLSEILSNNIVNQNYHIRFLTMLVQEQGLRLFKVSPGLVRKGYGIRAASEIMPQNFIKLSLSYLQLMQMI